MRGQRRRYLLILMLCAFAAKVGHARDICGEGIYSNMGEAKGSHDMFGSTLIVVDQTREIPWLPLKSKNTGAPTKSSGAHGIFSCTGQMDVRNDLVRLDIRYPKFTFELDKDHHCFPDNLLSTDKRPVIVFTGEFTDKGIWLTWAGRKEFLPRTRNYCATPERRNVK